MFTPVGKPVARSRGQWIEVLTVKHKRPLEVMVIGREPVSVAIHYHGRSFLCTGASDCPMCQAGVGRQHMLFVAAVHRKRMVLVRLAYQQFLIDALTFGTVCDISIPRPGQSYDVQIHLVKEKPGVEVSPARILSRILVLHGLRVVGGTDVSPNAVWEANVGEIHRRAEFGKVSFVMKQNTTSG